MITVLRILREERFGSQQDGANAIKIEQEIHQYGISITTYQPIESGRLAPTPRVARELEKIYGHPIDILLAPASAAVKLWLAGKWARK